MLINIEHDVLTVTKEYLRELSSQRHHNLGFSDSYDKHEARSMKVDASSDPTTVNDTSNFSVIHLSENSTFVASNHCLELYLSGFARINVMKGCVTINGYQLRCDSIETVSFPPWQPACYMACQDSENKSHSKSNVVSHHQIVSACFDRVYKSRGLVYGTASHDQKAQWKKLFHAFSFVLIIDVVPVDEQEWLVAAEDQSSYIGSAIDISGPTVGSSSANKHEWASPNLTEVSCLRRSSFIMGSAAQLRSLHFDCVTIPPSWEACAGSFLVHSHENNHSDAHTGSKLVVCGAKGVGKSTYTRYLLNRSLSDRHLRTQRCMKRWPALRTNSRHASIMVLLGSVCYIDCDVGQPEMSVPGIVSLHVINKPILAPPHMNIRKPDKCFFLGDVSSKAEPKLALQCIALLYRRYLEIRQDCIDQYIALKQQQTQELLSTNAYNALLLEDDDDENAYGAISDISDILPLIVNTDGYIKSMGAEILSGILSIVQPTHIVHLCTERDKAILAPTLDEHDFKASQSLLHTAASLNSSHSSSSYRIVVRRVTLTPGRIIAAPQIAAVELRSLRLISYFLRFNKELIKFTKTYHARFCSTGSANAAMAMSANDCIHIRNGSIVDSTGILAAHFLKSSAYSIPFSKLLISSVPIIEIPSSLTLASINASLVAFIQLDGYSTSQEASSELYAMPTKRFRYDTKHLLGIDAVQCNRRNIDDNKSSIVEFELAILSRCPVAECVGIGFVRFIDIPNSCLFITSQHNDYIHDMASEAISSNRKMCIVRGNLQLPTSMIYSPSLVCFPYFTSETAGEGATKSRNRHNVKRRNHISS